MPKTDGSGWLIHWERHGDASTPPILLTLGLSHRIAHWGRLPQLLAERLFVITFDCRNIGESERRDEPYTVSDEVADMVAVLNANGLASSAIYGRSRGGMLAQEFALTHPDLTTALILVGTSHRGPGSLGSTERVEAAMKFSSDMTREDIFTTQNAAMAAPGWRERDPEAFAYCLGVDLEAPPRRFAVQRQREAMEQWSSYDRLDSIAAPTLILCGEDDGMVPPDNSRDLARHIPGAKLELIPQCGHLAMLEKPEIVARSVFAFLEV